MAVQSKCDALSERDALQKKLESLISQVIHKSLIKRYSAFLP